jgi:lipopolysaccharide export system protein LptC
VTLSPTAIDLKQATIVLRHEGQTQAELRADRVEVSRDLRYATFVGNPTVVVLDQGQGTWQVGGHEIILDRQTSDVTVLGPVELASVRGGRLKAGQVRWLQAAQQLVFDQGVTMTWDGQKLLADRLTITVGQQALEFSSRVDIAFRLEGRRP